MLSDPRTVRPYQLACLVCRAGSESPEGPQERVADLAEQIRLQPDLPLLVAMNSGEIFAYQDPGTADDTPESADFNLKRDLDLLQWLDLAPGTVLPARLLLGRLLLRIPSVKGICGYEKVTGEAWRGCSRAFSGDYERGQAMGLKGLLPQRTREEMEADKARSMAALRTAEVVKIRPHILLCSVCQYANGARPPFAEDNLPELLQMVMEKDCKLKVKLVPSADWDMCAPCPSRIDGNDGCVCGKIGSGGLYNQVKDVNVLQALGLTYGTVMEAREMYRLIFDRIPAVSGVCVLNSIPVPEYSVWHDGCSNNPQPGAYEKGREMLREVFAE
ncbi:MAG: hypothetical protein ABFE08_24030 [Armatimonadia bacterium]